MHRNQYERTHNHQCRCPALLIHKPSENRCENNCSHGKPESNVTADSFRNAVFIKKEVVCILEEREKGGIKGNTQKHYEYEGSYFQNLCYIADFKFLSGIKLCTVVDDLLIQPVIVYQVNQESKEGN